MVASYFSRTSKHHHPHTTFVVAKLRMLLSECRYCLLGCDASHSLSYFVFVFIIRARSTCPRCTAAYSLIVRPILHVMCTITSTEGAEGINYRSQAVMCSITSTDSTKVISYRSWAVMCSITSTNSAEGIIYRSWAVMCSITSTEGAKGINYTSRAVICSIRYSLITNKTQIIICWSTKCTVQ